MSPRLCSLRARAAAIALFFCCSAAVRSAAYPANESDPAAFIAALNLVVRPYTQAHLAATGVLTSAHGGIHLPWFVWLSSATAHLADPQLVAVLLQQGQGEPCTRYEEVIYDLFTNRTFMRDLLNNKPLAIFCAERRGQGYADRLPGQFGHRHLDRFDYYADDQLMFIDSVLTPRLAPLQRYLVMGVSAGGLLAVRMLQRELYGAHNADVARVLLNVPAVQIMATVQEAPALALMEMYCAVGSGNALAPGQSSDLTKFVFEGNTWTHSRARFAAMRQEVTLTLGTTAQMARELLWHGLAARSSAWLYRVPKHTPVYLVEAKPNDTVVVWQGEEWWCRHTALCQLVQIAGQERSFHGMHCETDDIRTGLLNVIRNFVAGVL